MPIINSVIASGPAPTGTKQITNNGTHDVAAYEYADVQVPTTAPAHYIEKSADANGKLINGSTLINLSGITDIGSYVLYSAYQGNTTLSGQIDFSGITQVSGSYACYGIFNSASYITSVDLSNLTQVIGNYAFANAFTQCSRLTSFDLSSLEQVTGQHAFDSAFRSTSLTGIVDFSALETINGSYAFYYCFNGVPGITGINFNSLEEIGYSGSFALSDTFEKCTGLTTVDFPKLKRIRGQNAVAWIFRDCSNLTTVKFNALEIATANNCFGAIAYNCPALTTFECKSLVSATGRQVLGSFVRQSKAIELCEFPSLKNVGADQVFENTFEGCTALKNVYFWALNPNSFGSYTTQFYNTLGNVTGCTVHFPSNMQSVIGSWAAIVNGLSGTNTTILWDLPATVILTGANSTNYERSPKDDTATALAWRVQDGGTVTDPVIDWTPFYTSGTTDPQVNDTIYSDSACTTAVTTISSIA